MWLFLLCSGVTFSALSFPPPLASSPKLLTVLTLEYLLSPQMCHAHLILDYFVDAFPCLESTSVALCLLMNFFFKSQLLGRCLFETFLKLPIQRNEALFTWVLRTLRGLVGQCAEVEFGWQTNISADHSFSALHLIC